VQFLSLKGVAIALVRRLRPGHAQSSCEIRENQRGQEPWNPEAEGFMAFGVITRPQPIKTQQTGKK
jgi:hypothetical protein